MRSWPISAPRAGPRWLGAFFVAACAAPLGAMGASAGGGTPLPLNARVLRLSDVQRYTFLPRPREQGTTRDPATWSKESGPTTVQLRRDGFVVGIREDLGGSPNDTVAESMAAQFKTPAGAARAAAQAVIHPRRFPVLGIPGARGFMLISGSTNSEQFFISFSDGVFAYLEGFARPLDEGLPYPASMAAATVSLYHRVHARPSPR